MNEESNILSLYLKINSLLQSENLEFIIIDDGSSDNTWEEVKKLSLKDPNVKGIRFARNFGQQLALDAGLKASTGSAVISLDADFQHPPELLPEMLKKWRDGVKIVKTRRLDTEKTSWLKKNSSSCFYRIFNSLSGMKLEQGSADFRLMDRSVVDYLIKLSEHNKFFRGLVDWTGMSHATIEYHPNERSAGKSSYSVRKMLELAEIAITNFSYTPLKFIILFGAFLSVSSTLLFIIAILCKYLIPNLFSSAALFGSFILANTGVIIVMLGVIALYQINIYKALQKRPDYIVAEKINS